MTDAARFIWHELRVPDLDAAAQFYGELLGWTFTDNPMGKTITMGGTAVGGATPVKQGVPNHWTPFIATDDVPVAAEKAKTRNGFVTTGDPVVTPVGTIAPILDPQMSIFVACSPSADGAQVAGTGSRHGRFVWDRLRTNDLAASAAFYRNVVGWQVILDGHAGVAVSPDGTRVAELIEVSDDAQRGWLPFVHVDDLRRAQGKAVELGAVVVAEPTHIPGKGSFVTINDPQGATVALHEAA